MAFRNNLNEGGKMSVKSAILHRNGSGKISLAKIGGSIIAIAGIIVTLPELGVVGIPIAIITAAKVAIAVGAKLGIDGLRNAQDKK
jgi:hypothetical protein